MTERDMDQVKAELALARNLKPNITETITCAFNMKEAGYVDVPCWNPGSRCGWCACSGPCLHELNPLCHEHAGFIEGFIFAQPPDPNDEEGLEAVRVAAARFIKISCS